MHTDIIKQIMTTSYWRNTAISRQVYKNCQTLYTVRFLAHYLVIQDHVKPDSVMHDLVTHDLIKRDIVKRDIVKRDLVTRIFVLFMINANKNCWHL